jgi:nitrite reductase (NADH) large subunit
MYGGVTNAEQLRRIADAIDKYNIPLVKLTGGARFDLLGIDAALAGAIGFELGQPLSAIPAYGHTIGSVATCAGIGYDSSAMQDSVRLGTELERRLEHMQLPAPAAVAVSASPLHRAGTLAKELGIAGVPGGWELYVGGSGGTKLRQGELLCMEPTGEKVIELAAAFLQWYREQANYGETTAEWVERIGITQVREGLFDLVIRDELIARWDAEHRRYAELKQANPQPAAALTR